jgi:S1-C subfamily serine protease
MPVTTNRRLGRIAIALAFLAMVVALADCSGSGGTRAKASPASAAPVVSGAVPPPAQPGIPAIVQHVSPSVVTIITPQGLGSGVVWASDGTIVTDDHVVSGSAHVTVAFADGRRVNGDVVGGDAPTDLAVVKASRTGLPAATFDGTLPQVGSLAIAIGSPLGFANTVSAGVVSGLQRSIPGSASQGAPLADLLQTDAAISPGDSGGALVGANGAVIGINEAYIPPSEGAVSIGFATPASTVEEVVPQLLKNGHAVHPFVGVEAATLTPELASKLDVSVSQGAVVLDVVTGSPAAKGGIQAGDVVTKVDGTTVASVEDFVGALRSRSPGDVVTITAVRGSTTRDFRVTLGAQPS